MKTVSTKLENKDYDRLINMCNDDGESISESLRDMIKRDLECHDEYLDEQKNKNQEKTTVILTSKDA